MSKLQHEIKKARPFDRVEEEVLLNLMRTADVLARGAEELLKPAGLTSTQYNVLRILRGAGDALACGEIASRMITRDPDITRLLDRLEQRGLISRSRGEKDRRVVTARITDAGLKAIKALDAPLQALQRRQLGHMTPEKLRMLSDLLEEARSPE